MDVRHAIQEGFYAYHGRYWRRETPVIVYAPGRVGSMGLLQNLRDAGVFSFKVESFNRGVHGSTAFVQRHVIAAGAKADIISPVRDPVAIMCSYFFSKCGKGWIPGGAEALAAGDVEELQRIFIEDVLRSKRLDDHLYWFENEFVPTLGVNVFDHPFDTKAMYGIIPHKRYRTLIFRSELDDAKKEAVLREFLDTDDISVTRENVRAKRDGAELYAAFKDTLSLPRDVLEKIYTAPYATHFFGEEERAGLWEKWGA